MVEKVEIASFKNLPKYFIPVEGINILLNFLVSVTLESIHLIECKETRKLLDMLRHESNKYLWIVSDLGQRNPFEPEECHRQAPVALDSMRD